jgi:ElaB/YqjD/DUF883 family membrane-anchored ribosome-binding protein
MSVYGIETEDDCRKAIDELIAMADSAEEELKSGSVRSRHTVEALKSRLQELFKKNKRSSGPGMSAVEAAYLWPAIQDAYVSAPKISSPKTWPAGVAEIKMNLRYRRPADKKRGR